MQNEMTNNDINYIEQSLKLILMIKKISVVMVLRKM